MTVTGPDRQTDDRQTYEFWFARSCDYAELVGRIDGYTDAGLTADTITASEALARIRQLVDQFKAASAVTQRARGDRRGDRS
jgi:hypothetical protein